MILSVVYHERKNIRTIKRVKIETCKIIYQ